MRILNVITQYWPYRGGAPNYVKEMSERFVRDGNEVTVYTTNAWDLDYLFFPDRKSIDAGSEVINGVRVNRYPVRHLPAGGFVRKIMRHLPSRAARFLFRFPSAILPEMWRDLLVRARDFDLIHAAPSPFYSLLYPAFFSARLLGVPFCITPFVHVGTPRGDSQLAMHTEPDQLAVLRASALVIVQSRAEKKALVERGVAAGKVEVLGMGVNPDDIAGGSVERFRKKHNIGADERIVSYVGALIYDKGAFHALDAVGRLRRRGDTIRLVMAGHPSIEFQEYLGRQPRQVKEGCILLGNVGGEDKLDLFAACDVLVLPSRGDSYGIVYLEAWLAGKPVIGSYAGGVPEVIADGEDGFLVPFGDDHMLGEYIRILLQNDELSRRMGEKGRKKVLDSCTWDQRYEKVKQWFKSTVDV
ncbi:MAG: glycosyltransferase family 4 protein [Candidatus Tritonobacter lacicola]|nr:glycosyltransferase family 4 protein [Candidatus Tritonobacter lacicola]